MAKNIKVLVNTGNEETNKTFDVASGSGKAGKPTTIKAVKGARYHLEDPAAKNVGPENIRSKRVGKNLHVMLDGSKDADLIIEDYYDDAMLTENNRGLYGRAEDGKLYEYIPEDPTASGLPINMADGGKPVSQVLGGGQVGEEFALSGLILAAAGGGFSALTAGAAAVGAAALAGGGGGGGGGAAAVTDPAATALTSIKTAAENNTATSGNLAASVFTTAGITGVDANNLAAIQSALDSAAVNGAAADTKAEVQAIVDAYNAIKANADTASTTNATQAQYAAVGVTGIDNAAKTNLLGDVVDTKAFADVDTVGELQTLADAAAAVITGAAAGTQPTKAQLEALGITGVTDANLSAIQAAIAATPDDGTGVDTLTELQTVVTNAAVTAAALDAIKTAAENNSAGTTPSVADFATAGITGVDANNFAAINSALNSAAVNGAAADTKPEVQAIVDAYNAIKANADTASTTNATAAQYAAVGVTGIDNTAKASLLGDVVDTKAFADVDTVLELQTLATAAAAVITGAAAGTQPTKAQLEALGITGVTDANLSAIQAAIAATPDDGTGVDTLTELQAVANTGATNAANAAAALSAISAAAQANNATDANVAIGVFATAGVTGVDASNVAAIQSALNSAAVVGTSADTLAEVQAIVDAYKAVQANADGTANNYATNPTQAQYAAIGVTGVDSNVKASLLGDVVDAKAFTAVDTVPELQVLADAAAAVMTAAAGPTGGSAPTRAQLEALGITGVTDANLQYVQDSIARTADDGIGVDTLAELQAVVTIGADAAAAAAAAAVAAAREAIRLAAENNNATDANVAISVFVTAGVTGVDSTNVAAIQSALNSAAVNGLATDTLVEVQNIVNAYNAIRENADGQANNYANNPTQAQYALIGVTGVDSATKESLLGDVVDAKPFTAVDSVPELQALADAAAAVIASTTGGTAPTQAQLTALGITGVTSANLAAVVAAIAATGNGGTGVDTLTELQTVVTNAAAAAALDAIKTAAENNSAGTTPSVADFATAGITGVDANNFAAINSALNSAAVNGAAADTKPEVQAIVDAYNAIKANADTASTANATQAQYAAVGVTGIDNAAKTSLLGDVVDTKAFADVDSVPELQALADAAAAVIASTTGGTAPTQAQLNALGITGVTPANLAAVVAAIAATGNGGTGVDTLTELQTVVTNAAAAAAALDAIKTAAENNSAGTTPSVADFATAGITGVDSTNFAAINSALNSAAVNGAAADTKPEVQAIVDAYNAIKANADGTAANYATNPTQAQYTAIGVTGVSTPEQTSLLGDVIDAKPFTAVDTVAEVQALADAAAAVIASTTTATRPTLEQLTALGITGVTPANLAAIQAAIAATADDGTGVDTLAELQAVANTGATNAASAAAAALSAIAAAAQANNATDANVATTVFATAGVTGVDANNVAAIQSALNSAAVLGTSADTLGEVQAIVDAYNAIKANADTASTANATDAQYAAIGVTGVDSAVKTSLLGDAIDGKAFADVDTVAEVQALADAAAAVMSGAAGSTAPNQAQLAALGITGVTPANLAAVQAAIAATTDNGTGVDTLSELQTVVTNAVNAAAATTAALDTIKAAAEANSATSGNLAASVFATAGVTGVDGTNLSAIQSALDSAAVNGLAADTTAEVQAIVDAYKVIKDNADTAGTTNATAAQYTAVGVTGIDNTAKASLLGDVVDTKAFADVDTVPELQTLATAAAAVITGAAAGTPPTKAQLEALGITGVTDANLSAIQVAIAATADDGTGVDTLSELQAVANTGATNAANAAAALSTIAAAAQANNATDSNVPASVFATAGVTGVDANNIAAIQSALNDTDVQSAQADTAAKVQAVVDAYNAIKANADTASTANATQAQYAAIGVNGIDNAAKTSLLGDVVDTKAFADVDTVAKVQALADLAALVINSAGTGTAPTKEQLQALGITGVTDANLSAIQAAIAATADDGTGVDTLAELQAVATAGATNAANAAAAAAALSTIAAAAQANDATNTNVAASVFATAGVTGVDSTNVAAIQSALNSAAVVGTSVDTLGEVQAVVDAYKAILAEANDTANTAGNGTPDANPASNPTAAQYAAIGVNLGSAPTDAATDPETLALLNAIVGGKQAADVGTVADVQALATIANAIQLKAAGGTPSPALTIADLQKIGLDTTGVSTDNLPTLLAAIAGKSDTGSETDTLEKLQALITNLDKVVPVAVADTATLTENFVLSNGNLSTNDTSLDGSETYSLVGSGTGTYAALTLTMTNGVYAGGYVLSPNSGTIHAITANVTDTFTYRVTDAAGNTSTNTVTFTFTPVNTAPVNTVPLTTQTLNEDATQVISGLSIADVDANGSSETVTLAVAHGSITVAAGTGVTLGTNGTGSVTLSGTVSAINTLLATANAVTYAPTANYNGSDTLTMTTNDGGNTGSGGALTDVDTVAITVNAVNDAPTGAVSITGTVKVGQVLTATSTVADVDGLGTLAYSWYANGTAISGATSNTYTLVAGDQGKTITAQVSYTDGGNTAEHVTSAATTAVAAAVSPGDSVIDLGASGKLIAPVQVEGKWYYFWDRSGDGTSADTGSLNGSTDKTTHDTLDAIFKYDINGNLNPNVGTNTNDVYRYATINGVQVALPMLNGNLTTIPFDGNFHYINGSAYSDAGATSNGTNSTVYDDFAALWDAYNGTVTGNGGGTGVSGVPTAWAASPYWTASYLSADGSHSYLWLSSGYTLSNASTVGENQQLLNVALQVVAANAAPVLADTALTLTGVSAGAAAPVNGTTTGSDLVSSLVGGITDADAGATKGIAITGVHTGGTLYYSVDGGTTWTAAANLSDTNALLLASDSDTRVYYKANNASGTFTDAITFRAWDMTANITEGVYTDTTPRGGKAQFSTATDTVSVVSTLPLSATLDLGASAVSGVRWNLIDKVTGSNGKVYYHVDTSFNNNALDASDYVTHDTLDTLFNGGADTTGLTNPTAGQDTERSVIVNGYTLVLPTRAEFLAALSNTTGWNTAYGWCSGIGTYWTADANGNGTHWDSNNNGTGGIFSQSRSDTWTTNFAVEVKVPVAPVVLDLNRDGTFSYSQVAMDVNGSNHLSLTQWAGAQDGVLVWDKLGDGVVHDNSQYAFGQYATSTRFDAAGYNRLASDLDGLSDAFDTNHDGVFNAADAKFAEFKVWQDVNQNGVSDAGEVRSLADWGITSINLVSDGVQRTPVAGVTEVGQSTAALADGSSMQVADALFAYNALDYSVTGNAMNLLGADMHLDLSSVVAVHSNVTAMDLTGTGANTVKLSLADVLSVATDASIANGVHKLTLTGDANDTVELDLSQWANTGNTVTEGDHTYAVYNASSAAAAQLLIDQHMVLANHG